MPVRRDHEVSVTAGVLLTGNETNKIAAALPPAIEGKGQMLIMEGRAPASLAQRRHLRTVVLRRRAPPSKPSFLAFVGPLDN